MQSYLLQDNYLRLSREEGRLAALSLQYLTFESFHNDLQTDEDLSGLARTGFFAFLDYAILHWVDHLEIFLRAMETEDLDDLENLGPIGGDFSAMNGPLDTPDVEAVQSFEIKCREARDQPSFDSFVGLIEHSRRMRSNNEDLIALGELGTVLSRCRSTLEGLVQS